MKFNQTVKTNLKTKILFSIFGFIFLFLAIFFIIALPLIVSIYNIKIDIDGRKSNLIIRESHELARNNYVSKIDEFDNQLVELDDVFLRQENIGNFELFLNKNAIDCNLEQQIEVLTDLSEDKNNYSEIPINIYLKGNFNDILRYLYKIEESNYYLLIDSFEIGKVDTIRFLNINQSESSNDCLILNLHAIIYLER